MHRKYLESNNEFNFYSSDTTAWNYNYLLLEPEQDIYNNYKPFKSFSYNGMKHNILIYFKELLKLVNYKNLIIITIKKRNLHIKTHVYLCQSYTFNVN